MSDLVKKLKTNRLNEGENVFRLRYEAAARIEALEAENERLRAALADLLHLDQRCGWHSKAADAAKALLDENEKAPANPAP